MNGLNRNWRLVLTEAEMSGIDPLITMGAATIDGRFNYFDFMAPA